MNIHDDNKKEFKPVSITLESQAEVNALVSIARLAGNSYLRDEILANCTIYETEREVIAKILKQFTR